MTQINIKNQPVTMQDVANRLGVSHTTISQVLRGVGRISEERQHEIRRVVQEMGYRPHVGAQLLSSKKTGQLGLIISQSLDIALESGLFGPILGNFIRSCQEDGQSYDIEVVSLDDTQPFEPPRQLTGQLVDGALIAGKIHPALADWLSTQNRYPWVCIGDEAPYSVHSLLDDGIYQAVQHLAALGHQRIAFMGGPLKYRSQQLMRSGFDRAVLDFRLNPSDSGHDWAWQSDDSDFSPAMIRQAKDHIQSLLNLPEPPTAFVCFATRIARLVIHLATAKGLTIPQNLSVIAAGTAQHAEMGFPMLSSVEPDYPAMVEQAVLMLRRLVAGRLPQISNQTVKPHLVMRETVCVPTREPNVRGQ